MGSSHIQTPSIKTDSEFVDKATELIIKIPELVDKCCPDCQKLLKSGLGYPTPNTTADTTNPEYQSGVSYTVG